MIPYERTLKVDVKTTKARKTQTLASKAQLPG